MSPAKRSTGTFWTPVRGRPKRLSTAQRERLMAELPAEAVEALEAELERRQRAIAGERDAAR
jgi:transposase